MWMIRRKMHHQSQRERAELSGRLINQLDYTTIISHSIELAMNITRLRAILHPRVEKDCDPQVMIIYNKRSKRAGKQHLD